MKLRFLTALALIGTVLVVPAFALDLKEARSSGLVGEKLDGYVAGLKSTPDVQALVTDVNGKRQQEYARISKENGQPVSVVAKLAAEQIINRLESGSFYQTPDGKWTQAH